MTTLEVGNKKVKIYDDIDELPVRAFQRFNTYLLQDAEIGSKMTDIDSKFKRLDSFLVEQDFEKALQERKNLHQALWNAFLLLDHKSLSFATLIHSIDGKVIEDTSIDGLQEIIDELSNAGLLYKDVREIVDAVKKKYMEIYMNISENSLEQAQHSITLLGLKIGAWQN